MVDTTNRGTVGPNLAVCSDRERCLLNLPAVMETQLLCCVCDDKTTNSRYEVLYKQTNRSITILDISANKEELELLTGQSKRAPGDWSVDSETEYYNFPAKHPRHGHLKWPVAHPVSPVNTYPDYPVHLPTVTLSRIKPRQGNNLGVMERERS